MGSALSEKSEVMLDYDCINTDCLHLVCVPKKKGFYHKAIPKLQNEMRFHFLLDSGFQLCTCEKRLRKSFFEKVRELKII